jgi:hypothetical protein
MDCCWNIPARGRDEACQPGKTPRPPTTRRPAARVQTPRADHAGAASPGRALREAWIAWLEQWRWEWYCTLTFREEVHPEAAKKRFRTFEKMINRSLYGPRWFKHGRGIGWVLALEYQRRGVIHFHALLTGVGDVPRRPWIKTWRKLAGFATIEPIESPAAVLR